MILLSFCVCLSVCQYVRLSVVHFTKTILVGSLPVGFYLGHPIWPPRPSSWNSIPDYSSRTVSDRLMVFAPGYVAYLEYCHVLKSKVYTFKNGHHYFILESLITRKCYLRQKGSDLDETWYVGTNKCHEWIEVTFVFIENPRWPPWRHICYEVCENLRRYSLNKEYAKMLICRLSGNDSGFYWSDWIHVS